MPFGTYETNLVSDSLTLEIGETRETAILAGFGSGRFGAGVYLFDGDLENNGDSRIDSFGAFIGYSRASGSSSFAVNVGYISDIGDPNGLRDTIQDSIDMAVLDYDDRVAGFTVDAMLTSGPFTFITEYTTAAHEFHAGRQRRHVCGRLPGDQRIGRTGSA